MHCGGPLSGQGCSLPEQLGKKPSSGTQCWSSSTMTSCTVDSSFAVGKPVQVATRNNEADTVLYESDIVLRRQKRSAMNCDCFWPKSQDGLVKIPVNVSSDFSVTERAWIVEAMQEFNTLTCVRFVNRTTESSYIKVVPGQKGTGELWESEFQ
ncbi:hypothetical protein Y1Q_0000485 [Alligator mississippiensis]|uniref:Peptidase M12A domain-containing protein n=1 Tax=Alligator mississippiensis TaxID=8496 RepID=A0A151MBA4_ALLMI|nr:hypothetical protein Y1Q_0000485 [Alligator mississippiensis]